MFQKRGEKRMKAFIFDFDGTILDTETPWFDVFAEIAQTYGTTLTLDVWSKCVGTSDDYYYEFLARESGQEIDIEGILKIKHEKHKVLMDKQPLREGVLEYIKAAKENGLKLAVASSSSYEWVAGNLKKFGLAEYFDAVLTSDHVINIKPDPELYIKAMETLGVTASEAFAFEDSPNGTRAAKAAGLPCVIVPNSVTNELIFDEYDLKISSMAEMPFQELFSFIKTKVSV
jgi:putative hydrolase of the HAD superfamily